MKRRPHVRTRTDTLFPYATRFRSPLVVGCEGAPAVPEQHGLPSQVAQAVGQGVEVAPEVVREAEGDTDRVQHLGLGRGEPSVDVPERPAGTTYGLGDVVGLEQIGRAQVCTPLTTAPLG